MVAATGLELLFLGGIELGVDGEPVDIPSTLAYKGMMLEGVPNLAMAVGYTNASWTLKCDLTCRYVTRLLNHLRDSRLRQCTPVNDDPSVEARPLLGLTSGYVQRSQDRFPKQGSRFPWQVYQSYLRDYRALRLRGIQDRCATRLPTRGPGAGRRPRSRTGNRPDSGGCGPETGGHGDHRPVNLTEALASFTDIYSPRIVTGSTTTTCASLTPSATMWHVHDDTDEFFLVLDGSSTSPCARPTAPSGPSLRAGDTFVVPRGTEHRPSSPGGSI